MEKGLGTPDSSQRQHLNMSSIALAMVSAAQPSSDKVTSALYNSSGAPFHAILS